MIAKCAYFRIGCYWFLKPPFRRKHNYVSTCFPSERLALELRNVLKAYLELLKTQLLGIYNCFVAKAVL